ncbi:ferritin-like domain-containing protein [Methylobrevis albus]|uniref:Ferritin-like domain-containing protein n=1 Tax=Methylobrevis albus TaxID=2793297 RepID=A0A931I229_9HYPH|nr:ferritin-like domain-containing protein [Methylobrevis albus]MBH0237858.1 ferritin-like domain-containing protein [Methylobrevis albus]
MGEIKQTSLEGLTIGKDALDAGRRAFLRSSGLMAAGAAALVGGVAASDTAAAQSAGINDADILNFALNLEYLEAEFYLRAVKGSGLADADTTGVGTLGPVAGGRRVPFTTPLVREYAEEIAADEEAHVKFLRAGLGTAAVARPRIDLRDSFTAAALAAGLIEPGQRFDAFANETNFLLAAFIFEDVGVTAYKGAARFLNNKDFLEAAAGILAVEAYHAGEIRTLLLQRGLSDPAFAISRLRDNADGPGIRDQGILRFGKANIVPADANGIVYSRTPAQVLSIVYLGGEAANNGFFPNRLNGGLR